MNEENKPEVPPEVIPDPVHPEPETQPEQPAPITGDSAQTPQDNLPNGPVGDNTNSTVAPTPTMTPQPPAADTGSVGSIAATLPPAEDYIPTDDSRVAQLRGLLAKVMLGILVAGAVIAVVAILAGSMSDIAWRAVGTLVAALIHLVLLFGVLSMVTGTDDRFRRSNDILVNVSLVIAGLSLFTSIFLVWDVMGGVTATKLYMTYIVVMIAAIHTKALADIVTVYDKVRYYVYTNYFFIGLVTAMILGLVYLEVIRDLFSGFYGRLLAAAAVVNVTLSVVTVVMHRLHLQKNPELADQTSGKAKGMTTGKLTLLVILFLLIGWPLLSILAMFVAARY